MVLPVFHGMGNSFIAMALSRCGRFGVLYVDCLIRGLLPVQNKRIVPLEQLR